MKKLTIVLLLLVLVPTAVFASDFRVHPSLFSGAPNFANGPEYDSTTIYQMNFTNQQRAENTQEFIGDLNAATSVLQAQADENAKKLAEAVEKNNLPAVEERIRKLALAENDTVEVKSDANHWELTYTAIEPNKVVRKDIATVDYTTSKCSIVTRVAPYGIAIFSVAQFKK